MTTDSTTTAPTPVDPADRAEAAELLARYAEAIDAGDFDAVGELFSDAVMEDASGMRISSTRDEVVKIYEGTTLRHADGTPLTAHVITNVIVDALGPDELQMRSRFTVFQATDTLPLQPVVVGRYTDTVRRIDGRWRFVHRVMAPQAWGDVSQHLSFDPRTI